MESVIDVSGLTKTYGSVRALDGLTLSIPRGGVYGVLGPNGAGKSTLFRILLGLIRPTAGEVRVMGQHTGDPAANMADHRDGWDGELDSLVALLEGRA